MQHRESRPSELLKLETPFEMKSHLEILSLELENLSKWNLSFSLKQVKTKNGTNTG